MKTNETDYAKMARDFYKLDNKYLSKSNNNIRGYKACFYEYYSKNQRLNDQGFSIEDIALYKKGKKGYSLKLILRKDNLWYLSDSDCNIITDGYDHILFLVDQTPTYSGFLVQRNGMSGILSIEGKLVIPCEYQYLQPICLHRAKHPDDKEYQEIVYAFCGNKPGEYRNLISCDGKIAFNNISFTESIQSIVDHYYDHDWGHYDLITEKVTKIRIFADPFEESDGSGCSSKSAADLSWFGAWLDDGLEDDFDESLDKKTHWECYDHLFDCEYGSFLLTYSVNVEDRVVRFENIDNPSLKVKQNTGYVKRFTIKSPKKDDRIDCFSIDKLNLDIDKSGLGLRYIAGKEAVRRLAKYGIYGGQDIADLNPLHRLDMSLTCAGIRTIYDLCQLDKELMKKIKGVHPEDIDYVIGVKEEIHKIYPDEQNDPPYQKGLLSPGTWMLPPKLLQYRDEWLAEGITQKNGQGKKRKFIGFYPREFFVLDNFSAFSIMYDCILYPTVEHAYQSLSFRGSDDSVADAILHADSAHDAQKIAYANKEKRRPTWEDEKLRVMYDLLKCKVEQHPYVRQKLLQIPEDYDIVEDSPKDSYWGWGNDRTGNNMLGKLWKKIQAELAEELKAKDDKAE